MSRITRDNTTLAIHTLCEEPSFKFSDVKVLGHEGNEKKRKMLEVINIMK